MSEFNKAAIAVTITLAAGLGGAALGEYKHQNVVEDKIACGQIEEIPRANDCLDAIGSDGSWLYRTGGLFLIISGLMMGTKGVYEE